MQPASAVHDTAQLRDLCGQFEQVLLASLVPRSLFASTTSVDEDTQAPSAPPSGVDAAIFTEALAAALERAGGVGLGLQMYRSLVTVSS
jgi:hypothetical protein